MSKVFVSYRREDSAHSAGRLYDRLVRDLGDGRVFMDVDGIPLGVDFVTRLTEEVATCDVLLAVIGPQWAELRDENGNRRLDDPNDFVRVEIRAALQRDVPVIPILLDGTRVPKAKSLPADIAPLATRNALDLRHASFQKDLNRLVEDIAAMSPGEAGRSRVNQVNIDATRYAAAFGVWVVASVAGFYGSSTARMYWPSLLFDDSSHPVRDQGIAVLLWLAIVSVIVLPVAVRFRSAGWPVYVSAFGILGASIAFLAATAIHPSYAPGGIPIFLALHIVIAVVLIAFARRQRWPLA